AIRGGVLPPPQIGLPVTLTVSQHFSGNVRTPANPSHVSCMIAERDSSHSIASRMLARFGVVFIWEAHVAAAAAHGLGQRAVAEDLTELAAAAEQTWLATRRTR